MNTSSFLTALRANASLPLVFRAGAETIGAGYHLTEVKRVAYETMDCGAMTHRWSESQFELWVPNSAAEARGHMPAEKFLRIVERVETELPLHDDATARIHASFNGQPAALYDIGEIAVRDGRLSVELTPDRTRCKAAERRNAASAGGCCATAASETAEAEGSGCGCDSSHANARVATCCA